MRLYKDKALLNQAIAATACHFNVDPSIVEKDYYTTVFLKKLAGQIPGLVLTGSASLSKCHHVTNRLSEDLDLTLARDPVSKEQRRQVKKAISEACSDLGFSLSNGDDIKSRRDFNRYEIVYSSKKSAVSGKPVFQVDIDYTVQAFPCETLPAASMIYDYMHQSGQKDFIRQYKLQPFPVFVRTMESTLIDKINILCDSFQEDRINGNSHHIYDISRLIEHVSPDDVYNIPELLSEILDKEIYKKDYDSITARLIYDDTLYEEASLKIRAALAGGLHV